MFKIFCKVIGLLFISFCKVIGLHFKIILYICIGLNLLIFILTLLFLTIGKTIA